MISDPENHVRRDGKRRNFYGAQNSMLIPYSIRDAEGHWPAIGHG